jgi:hypothetical protein
LDVTEITGMEDDTRDIDVQSEEDSDYDQEGDNSDVKMGSQEKKGRVSVCTSL